MIQRHVFIEGAVQGVGFRRSTELQAARYPRLKGWVRNLDDGRVEAVFSGEERDVLEMVAWATHGPPSARVTRIRVVEEVPDSRLGVFEVK